MFPTRSSSSAQSQMWGTASPSSGLLCSLMRGELVASSCWEFWVECALEYPSWRKSRGLLSALTSPTAPGNALHSSSWQLLGHFQKGWGKNTAGLFSGAFGTREWREPKEWDWKHMAAWEYLWLSHLSFPPGFCSWNHIMEKRPTPTKRTLPFTLSKNDSLYELISFNTPAASANDFQVGTTCSRCSCFIC